MGKKKFEANPITKRKCRECGIFLKKSNYFKCEDCRVCMENENIDDHWAEIEEENVLDTFSPTELNSFLDELEKDDEDGNWGEWPIPDLEGF